MIGYLLFWWKPTSVCFLLNKRLVTAFFETLRDWVMLVFVYCLLFPLSYSWGEGIATPNSIGQVHFIGFDQSLWVGTNFLFLVTGHLGSLKSLDISTFLEPLEKIAGVVSVSICCVD